MAPTHGSPGRRSKFLTMWVPVLGLGVAAASLAWGILGRSPPPTASLVAHLMDECGRALTDSDILLIGPSGDDVAPDNRGVALFPPDWKGATIIIVNATTGSWLKEATVAVKSNGILRITVPMNRDCN